MIEPHLVYGGTVVDYGCGYGRLMKPLTQRHTRTRFVGFDTSREALAVASVNARPNESYTHKWLDFSIRSAYSVLVVQHLPDDSVSEILRRVHPAPFRFQWVIGGIDHEWNHQRAEGQMEALCEEAGYRLKAESDPVYEEWRWGTAQAR